MNSSSAASLAIAAFLLLAGGDSRAQTAGGAPAHPLEARVDSIFAQRVSDSSPGCAVAVLRNGEVLLKKAYGMANIGLDVPMTTAISTWIPYSEARVFVALAVAMLARDGRISLDDPVQRHVPEVPPYAADVRVRQLIHHTSGLADYGTLAGPGWSLVDRLSEDEFFRILTRWGKLGFEPGSGVMYSNTDYALLKILVERVTGGSLHAYLDEQLLRPLGMGSTRIGADQTLVFPNHTLFHESDRDGYRTPVPYRVSPVGGISLTTSVDDLVHWERALRDRTLGLDGLFAELRRGAPSPEEGVAFGIYPKRRGGVELEEHRGVGEYIYLARVPQAGISVATVCTMYAGMWEYGPRVALLFAAPVAGAAVAEAAVAADSAVSRGAATPARPAVVSVAELQRYQGEYRGTRGGEPILQIAATGDGLEITTPGGGKHYARWIGNGVFEEVRSPALTIRLTFAGNDSSMTLSVLNVNTGEAEPPLQRWVPARPSADALRSYPGVYVGDDVEITLHVSVSGEDVLVAGRGLPRTRLEPTPAPDHFSIPDYDIVFHRDAAGRLTHLTLEATRVKGMRLTRSERR